MGVGWRLGVKTIEQVEPSNREPTLMQMPRDMDFETSAHTSAW
jgi:hypothetical protein